MDTGVITALSAAVNSIRGIIEIPGNIGSIKVRNELNAKIAELMESLITARQQMLEMQQKYDLLLKENKELKQISAPKEKPRLRWGCYEFEGEEGLFCTACYDTKGQKIRASRIRGGHYICNVCKAVLS